MKILVTGANGQLGRNLRKIFSSDNSLDVIYTDADTLDITNAMAVDRFLDDNRFDIIVNCAAYTAVDKAEKDSLTAARINTEAVGYIAEAARRYRARVIHISTDYVFSGENCRPYDEHDEPYPHSIYGRTKLEGEGVLKSFCPNAIIIRTAWLYAEEGANFVLTMLRKGREGQPLKVVADQIGTPTYARDLAVAIHTIVTAREWKPGIYHFTDEGVASWYDFAKSIFRIAGIPAIVAPCLTSEYQTPAKRPLYSVLNKQKIKQAYDISIPYWEDSLECCLRNIRNSTLK